MDAYRTICIAPPPEIRNACKAVRSLNIRTYYRARYRVVRIIACIEHPVMIKAIFAQRNRIHRVYPDAVDWMHGQGNGWADGCPRRQCGDDE